MTDKPTSAGDQKRSIVLDPSKFTIGDDGQVIITDPTFIEALRAATDDDEGGGHGITAGLVVST